MNTAERLTRAAELIEQRGWFGSDAKGRHKVEGGDDGMRFCALIAIEQNRPDDESYPAARTALGRVIGLEGEDDPCAIVRWNNAPERTMAEVLSAFRTAAAIEAAREAQPTAEEAPCPATLTV